MCSKLFIVITVLAALLCNDNIINAEDSSEIDISCSTHDDCTSLFQTEQINSQCYSAECKCFDSRNTTVKCRPVEVTKTNNYIGDPCPCPVENSSCHPKNNTCMCNNEYTISPDRRSCETIVHNITETGECDKDTKCIERDTNLQCDVEKKMCVCKTNFTMSENRCVPIVGITDQCKNDNDCVAQRNHTVCNSETKSCDCQNGYMFINESKECLPVTTHGNDCSNSNDCRAATENLVCVDGKCKCEPNYYHLKIKDKGIRCIKNKIVGDPCSRNLQCFEGNRDEQPMECLNGQCVCRPSYMQTNENRCESTGIRIVGTNLTLLIALWNFIFIYKITIFSN